MTRVRAYQIAAVLLVILAVIDLVPAIRILSYGSAGAPPLIDAPDAGGPPFWAGIMFIVLAVATLFGAYGLWSGQKWGKIVTLVTRAILLLFALGDLVGGVAAGALGYAAISAIYIVASLIVVYLVLRPTKLSSGVLPTGSAPLQLLAAFGLGLAMLVMSATPVRAAHGAMTVAASIPAHGSVWMGRGLDHFPANYPPHGSVWFGEGIAMLTHAPMR